jgi:hypothetical protein
MWIAKFPDHTVVIYANSRACAGMAQQASRHLNYEPKENETPNGKLHPANARIGN